MQLIPLYASLRNKSVLVVGGGDVAERKIQLLLQAGAHIHAVSTAFNNALQQLEHAGQIELIHQPFTPALLDHAWFVIAATDCRRTNADVAQAAQLRKLFVNVVDDPALSSVHIPAIVDRSPLMISISSTGAAPMIARHVREQIETLVDDALGQLTALAQTYRPRIRQNISSMPQRRAFYEWLIQGPVLQYLRDGDNRAAAQCLENALQKKNHAKPGHTIQITITSDEPGDITLRTLRALNQADTIFHDDRIHPSILNLARRDADRHAFTVTEPDTDIPDDIRQRLAECARVGKTNVLLTLPLDPSTPGRGSRLCQRTIFALQLPESTPSEVPVI